MARASPGKKLIDGRKKENSAPVPQIGGSDFDIHSVHAKPHAPILNLVTIQLYAAKTQLDYAILEMERGPGRAPLP